MRASDLKGEVLKYRHRHCRCLNEYNPELKELSQPEAAGAANWMLGHRQCKHSGPINLGPRTAEGGCPHMWGCCACCFSTPLWSTSLFGGGRCGLAECG